MRYAVVIGVSTYPRDTVDLVCAKMNAEAISAILSQHGGFEVRLLLDPSYAEVTDALGWLSGNGTDEAEHVLVYYSGHGFLNQSVFSFGCYGGVGRNDWSAAVLQDYLRRAMARNKTVVIDCCFSGQLVTYVSPLLSLGSGLTVLGSAQALHRAWGHEGDMSPYTRSIVEGIEHRWADLDGDSLITPRELHDYAHRCMQAADNLTQPFYLEYVSGCDVSELPYVARIRLAEPVDQDVVRGLSSIDVGEFETAIDKVRELLGRTRASDECVLDLLEGVKGNRIAKLGARLQDTLRDLRRRNHQLAELDRDTRSLATRFPRWTDQCEELNLRVERHLQHADSASVSEYTKQAGSIISTAETLIRSAGLKSKEIANLQNDCMKALQFPTNRRSVRRKLRALRAACLLQQSSILNAAVLGLAAAGSAIVVAPFLVAGELTPTLGGSNAEGSHYAFTYAFAYLVCAFGSGLLWRSRNRRPSLSWRHFGAGVFGALAASVVFFSKYYSPNQGFIDQIAEEKGRILRMVTMYAGIVFAFMTLHRPRLPSRRTELLRVGCSVLLGLSIIATFTLTAALIRSAESHEGLTTIVKEAISIAPTELGLVLPAIIAFLLASMFFGFWWPKLGRKGLG